MRLWITRLFCMKVVLAVAVRYVLCILTSSVALASENSGPAHCLSGAGNPAPAHTAQAASGHFRADGTWHEHHSDETQHRHDGKAVTDNCGCVFGVSALAITPVPTLPAPEPGTLGQFALPQGPRTVGAGARLYVPCGLHGSPCSTPRRQ